ncbi:AzlD family protein [Aestuariispira ectoiniformans]|uniref:AzlD family protein n=1 Tax=Aestuariispira ectoiniformans TaxID=2775080 RepID=UPI00223B06FB|nr:AzlD domain-containing protein [Aestuariispira ectoiniformans]
MSNDQMIILTILGMAAVTALTRYSGYWLMGRFAIKGRLAGALEAVPGAVLIAIITPTALDSGPAEAIAAIVTVILALRVPTLAAIAGGVGTVVALRYFIG